MPHFNAKAFEDHLNTVPDDLLIEMASDGIISEEEIQHLVELLNLDPEVAAAIGRNAEMVGQHIMEYVERTMPDALQAGMCQMTGRQAAEVMRHLLNEGLISKFYESSASISAQEGLPQSKTIHDVGKSSGAAPRGRR